MMPCAFSRLEIESSVSPLLTVKFTGALASPGGLSWRLSHRPAPPATRSSTTKIPSNVNPTIRAGRRLRRSGSPSNS